MVLTFVAPRNIFSATPKFQRANFGLLDVEQLRISCGRRQGNLGVLLRKFLPPTPYPTSNRPSQSTQSESTQDIKLTSFIVFLHVLKASASNGSKNKKW